MAGIFGSILGLTPKAQKYKKSMRVLQRQQADNRINEIGRQQDFRAKEDPREQAMLKGQMYGRGLGKSSIFDQDRDRLTTIQGNRNASLEEGMKYAREYRKMINFKFATERRSQYIQIIDSIIGLAGGGQGGEMGSSGGGDGGFGAGAGANWGSQMGAYGG
jgi:hypothetical protein